VDQTLHDAGDRAGVEAKDMGELAGRDPREPVDDPEHEALRPRDADGGLHLFRSALEAVLDAPQETHEVQGWVQGGVVDVRGWEAGHARQHTEVPLGAATNDL